MNRRLLFIPLALFLLLAMALFWQLMRNAEGDDPTMLESALIGKPLPEFRLEALTAPGKPTAGGADRRETAAAERLGHLVPDLSRRASVPECAVRAGGSRRRAELQR
jgi:hypothetical protein